LLPKIRVGGGSYDFYTGKIALRWKDEARVMAGLRHLPNRMYMGLPSRVVGAPMQPIDLQPFRYTKERGEF
jgi:hypothetical protein